jgi:hypothetical protein
MSGFTLEMIHEPWQQVKNLHSSSTFLVRNTKIADLSSAGVVLSSKKVVHCKSPEFSSKEKISLHSTMPERKELT